MTQASHIPVTKTIQERDIVEPMSSERARAAYLESQIQDMSSVWLPLNIPLMEEGSHVYRSNKKDQYVLQRMKRKKETGMGIS